MAKQRAPRRHHYIPQMILRNFVNAEGGLYFWRREFPVGEVRSTNTENLFLEDDLYTIVGDDGSRDVTLERVFAKLESDAARLIGALLAAVREGKRPRLNDSAWEFVHHYHYYAAKRSSAWHRRFVTRDEVVAVVNELALEAQLSDADRAWLTDQPDLDRVMNNARIAAQGTPPPEELLAVMRSRGLAIYVAPRGASFVMGDHPSATARIAFADQGGVAGKISFMPVAHDIAIGYFMKQRAVHVEHVTRRDVRAMNEAMTRQSMMIAGRSDALIRSLARIGYATPEYFTTQDYLMDE